MISVTPATAARLLLQAHRNARVLRPLGDVPGHEFHGNQYAAGGLPNSRAVARAVDEAAMGAKMSTSGAKVEVVDLSSLHPSEPASMTPVKELQDKYQKQWPVAPPVVNKNGVILDGHHRVASALAAGHTRIFVVRVRGNNEKPRTLASGNRDHTPIHAAADAHLKPMTAAVRAAFEAGRAAYRRGGTSSAKAAVRSHLLASLPPVLLQALVAGGEAGLGVLKKQLRAAEFRALRPQRKGEPHSTEGAFDLAFNVDSPEAIAWAKEHAGELASDISDTTEQAIKDAVAAALEGEGIDAAYDDILDAVGDDARAEMIARTEVMTAANEGQHEAWDQAVDAGLLPEDARVEWIATSDACPECDDLDGATRSLDGEYDDSDAGDGPPLHPNCRCTEGISA